MAAADLFDEPTAQVIAARLGRVLAAVAAGPGIRLREVQVLDAAERAQVVDGWNDTAVAVPGVLVPELIVARAAAAPDAVAVVCGDVVVSYGELAAGAGRLAQYLAAGGGGAGAGGGVVPGPGCGDGDGDGGGVAGGGGVPAAGSGLAGGAAGVHAGGRPGGAGGVPGRAAGRGGRCGCGGGGPGGSGAGGAGAGMRRRRWCGGGVSWRM